MDIPERHPGYTHMALNVTDIEVVQATIEDLGIEITEGPITLPDGGVMLFIRDQDRNVIEFHQDPPGQ
jgi:lactoylglutathione lyase